MELSMMAFMAMIFLRNWAARYGLIVFALVGSLPTGTRKIMFTVLGLAIMAVAQFIRYLTASRQRLLFFSAVALLVFCVAALAAAPLIDRLAQTQAYVRIADLLEGRLDYSARDRLTLLNEAVDIWLQNPIFGNGISSVQALSSFHLYAHNNYIELLASFGIIGFVLFYAFDFAVIAKLLPRAWKGSELHRQLLIVMIVVLIYDTSMVSYDTRSSTLLIRVLAAFLADRESLDTGQYNA
jgi:O-antigen ligase